MTTKLLLPIKYILLISCLLLSSTVFALPKILIFSKVSQGAYTHDSIPYATQVITQLGQGTLALNSTVADPSIANKNAKWTVVVDSDDSKWDQDNYLAQFDAIVFLMTKWVLEDFIA